MVAKAYFRKFLSLETCENMLLLPQGGLDRRRGFQFISANLDSSTLADGSTDVVTGSFHTQSRLIPFKFGEGQEYVLIVELNNQNVFLSFTKLERN